jgi:predicted DNA-binding transcriptional regulator AlpA
VEGEAGIRSSEERKVPALLDVSDAAGLLGIGRTLAYELVRTGQWPTPVIRVGRLIRIPSRPLYELIATGVVSSPGDD